MACEMTLGTQGGSASPEPESKRLVAELNARLEQSLADKRFRSDALPLPMAHPSVEKLADFIAESALRARALDKAPIAAYIKDADDDFRYVFVNDFTLRQLGRSREEMLGKNDFDLMPCDIASSYRQNDEAAMRTDESTSVQESYVDASGTTRVVQSVRCPTSGADGHRLMVGYSLELTELLEKQRRIEALQQTAERERDHAIAAEKAKDEFFASISHDIRTPLNSIIGFSELLKNETDPELRQEYLESITFSGNTLLELVNDVLDLARLDAGRTACNNSPFDIGRQIRLILRTFEATAREKRLSLNFAPGELPVIVLDEQCVRQLVFNLVGNAVKYTDSGSVTVSASFAHTAHGAGTLRIAVSDTGIGIAAEDISKLMLPYVRLQVGNARGGTGLGLAICKRIVDNLGGEIAIDSSPGKGSEFIVTIPGVKCLEGPARETVPQRNGAMSQDRRDFANLRVLAVDDLEMNLRVLVAGCRRLGVGQTTAASSSAEALALLKESKFDLVLTDMKMPGMDGGEFIKAVRADPSLRHLTVFLVTADIDARGYYKRMGADGVLLKPIVQSHLAEVIASVCDNGSGRRV